VILVVSVTSVAVMFGISLLAALVPGWLLMAQITRSDDRAFRVLWLWTQTKLANRLRLVHFGRRDEFWGASTYSPCDARRSWEREAARWTQ
jgi:type IV secretion system protein VirB3